ncbi:MAG: YidC/Oxa1 family membrane protein insertase [Eubacteriales bacterium]|nr:YidC/Oxa1 family membrane protein insertase [Eubacteriales bacterium]
MSKMVLTKSSIWVIGPVATVLGVIMNGIFGVLDMVNIQNIGLCIILFTFFIYMLLTPLTVKQQKFSKLSAHMNPELQKIQKKYKGKNDQVSMMKMNEETQLLYAKYGVSPMGSCLQLIIQMPILFALYQVIWNIPAYVGRVYDVFKPLAEALLNNSASQGFMEGIAKTLNISYSNGYTIEKIIDTLYKLKPSNWTELAAEFPSMSNLIQETQASADHMNYFLGLNISDSPLNIMQQGFAAGAWLLVIGALAIPVLSALTQWLNTKLMPQQPAPNGEQSAMMSSMKTMNVVMPLMSAFFCLTLPAGMGIYWIAGSVIRSIQQVIVNRHMDKMDIDELIAKNADKVKKKQEQLGINQQRVVNSQAKVSTRNINTPTKKVMTEEERNARIKSSTEYYKNSEEKPGSIAAKARMVEKYNEKNKK